MTARLFLVLAIISQLSYSCCSLKANYGETLFRTQHELEASIVLKFNLPDSTKFADAVIVDGLSFSGEGRIPTNRYSFYNILARAGNDSWETDWEYLVLIRNEFSQRLQERRSGLNKLNDQLALRPIENLQYLSQDSIPVLLINGSSYSLGFVQDYLRHLKPGQIKSIHFIDRPVNQTLYGANGKYGLVEIWAKRGPK